MSDDLERYKARRARNLKNFIIGFAIGFMAVWVILGILFWAVKL